MLEKRGWVGAAVGAIGVDQTRAALRTAATAGPAPAMVLALVTAQALHLRPPRPVDEPGYVLRHLCLDAMERGQATLADAARDRLRARTDDLVPLWTSRRTSAALAAELDAHDGWVVAVAALGDGRVVSGGDDGRVRLWDPAAPGAPVVEVACRARALASYTEPASTEHDSLLPTRGTDCRSGPWTKPRLDRSPCRLVPLTGFGPPSRGRTTQRARRTMAPMGMERITVDPGRMGGAPCIRDLRITVSMVLGQLASGRTVEELSMTTPTLKGPASWPRWSSLPQS